MILLTILGLWFLVSALVDLDWYYGVIDFQTAELLFGENAVRWVCGTLGFAMVVIGLTGTFHGH